MTRQEKLDAINMKIARTNQGDEGTGYFLPVMIGDILYYMDRNSFWIDLGDGHKTRDILKFKEAIVALHYLFIRGQNISLDKQSDDCIQYVYSLI